MTKTRGFSLVELSIVLVILGLLVGGVLTGQSLIRAAELRSVTTEFQKYQAAVNSFRDKYFALPGDMPNATSFWGDDNTNCPDAAITNGTPGTCNGSGNGDMGSNWNTEAYRAWQHLSLAGLIEGSYTGTATANTAVIGTNVPKAKLGNAGWSIIKEPAVNISSAWQGFVLGGAVANAYTYAGTVLKPEEAWNIDTKIDDGDPDAGGVRTLSTVYWSLCTTGATPTSVYNLTNTSLACGLYFSVGY